MLCPLRPARCQSNMATRQHAKRHNDASKLLMFWLQRAKWPSQSQAAVTAPAPLLAAGGKFGNCLAGLHCEGRATMIKGKRGQREEKKGSKRTKKEVEWTNTRRNKRPTKKQQEKTKDLKKSRPKREPRKKTRSIINLAKDRSGFCLKKKDGSKKERNN